jgi:hypothetical protein
MVLKVLLMLNLIKMLLQVAVVVKEKVAILIGFGDVSVVAKKERDEQIKEKLENIEKKQDVIKNKK